MPSKQNTLWKEICATRTLTVTWTLKRGGEHDSILISLKHVTFYTFALKILWCSINRFFFKDFDLCKHEFSMQTSRRIYIPSITLLMTIPLRNEPQFISQNISVRSDACHTASHVPWRKERHWCVSREMSGRGIYKYWEVDVLSESHHASCTATIPSNKTAYVSSL